MWQASGVSPPDAGAFFNLVAAFIVVWAIVVVLVVLIVVEGLYFDDGTRPENRKSVRVMFTKK